MSIGRVVHVPSAVLPASGAFTTQSAFRIPHTIEKLTAWVTYTRGGAGGKVRVQPLFGNGTEEGAATLASSATAVSAPAVDQPVGLGYLDGPAPADGSPITFELPFDVPSGARTFRVLVAELGATGTPGTCAVVLTGAARPGA